MLEILPVWRAEGFWRGKLTVERLRELLEYDPSAGLFTWRVRVSQMPAGSLAGCLNIRDNYARIAIDGHLYLAHRLAWFYMIGRWPKHQVDHIDGNRKNNKWANLREANQPQNSANAGRRKRNKSGFKGVAWDKIKWRASICYDQKQIYLGRFATKEEAHAAYAAAAKSLYGDFARLS